MKFEHVFIGACLVATLYLISNMIGEWAIAIAITIGVLSVIATWAKAGGDLKDYVSKYSKMAFTAIIAVGLCMALSGIFQLSAAPILSDLKDGGGFSVGGRLILIFSLMIVSSIAAAHSLVYSEKGWSRFIAALVCVVVLAVSIALEKNVPMMGYVSARYNNLSKESADKTEAIEKVETNVEAVFYTDQDKKPTMPSPLDIIPVGEKLLVISPVQKFGNVNFIKVQRSHKLEDRVVTYSGGTEGWVEASTCSPVRTQEAAATPTTSPAPASTPATAKKGESVTVSFNPGEKIFTGVIVSKDQWYEIASSAKVKIPCSEEKTGFREVTKPLKQKSMTSGTSQLVFYAGDQAGEVTVTLL